MKKIFLPSACGGGGSCANAVCQVLEGGENFTDRTRISRKTTTTEPLAAGLSGESEKTT